MTLPAAPPRSRRARHISCTAFAHLGRSARQHGGRHMRRRDVLVSASLGAAALAAPAVRSAHAQAGKTLVFGGSVPLTGAAAETGLNVNNGYITAVSYLNEKLGGVEI